MNATLPTDRNHWHELRAQHVGGSEIAALFYLWRLANGQIAYLHLFEQPPAGAVMLGCVSRHTTGYRLWYQKAGILPPDDLDGVERVMIGSELEPAIARAAARKWDPWPLRKVHRYLRHAHVEGMGASRDFEEHAQGLPPVEVKNVDQWVFRDLWQCQGDDVSAPPIDITLQVQHQIACESRVRAPHGWIVACVGGNSLKRGRIERHEPTIDKIKQAVTMFWAAVRAGTPPLDVADFDTQADVSLLGAEVRTEPLDLTGDNRLSSLCSRFLKLAAIRKRAEEAEGRVKAQIAVKLGDAPQTIRARTTGFNITWPLAQPKERKAYRGGLTIRETFL